MQRGRRRKVKNSDDRDDMLNSQNFQKYHEEICNDISEKIFCTCIDTLWFEIYVTDRQKVMKWMGKRKTYSPRNMSWFQ